MTCRIVTMYRYGDHEKHSYVIAAHFCVLDCDDQDYLAVREAVVGFAMTSHRAVDLGLMDSNKEEK